MEGENKDDDSPEMMTSICMHNIMSLRFAFLLLTMIVLHMEMEGGHIKCNIAPFHKESTNPGLLKRYISGSVPCCRFIDPWEMLSFDHPLHQSTVDLRMGIYRQSIFDNLILI